MAVDSTSADCYLMNKSESNKKQKSNEMTSSNNQLNFYESMYHFKKMFPKFDSDVIESVLRANNGSVDQTIDQLLSMAMDNEQLDSNAAVSLSSYSTPIAINQPSIPLLSNDLPPSYEAFMSTIQNSDSVSTSVAIAATVATSQKGQSVNLEKSGNIDKTVSTSSGLEMSKNITLVEDLMTFSTKHNYPNEKPMKEGFNDNFNLKANSGSSINESKRLPSSLIDSSSDSLSSPFSSVSSISKTSSRGSHGRIVIGELSKDFLRVKLTSDQVKKIKSSIKKAKRNELTAILNNKTPDNPDLSFQLQKKLSLLNEQFEKDENKIETGEDIEAWTARYNELSKTYEKRRIQMIQDEYIAKLIQNEEFLNELKTNKDFIQTLNNDSSEPHDLLNENPTSSIIMSNAELKLKLSKMSKASRMKLAKLASQFAIKAKTKYNKALDQTTITCTNLFTNFNTLKNTDNNNTPNGSYYAKNESVFSSIDDDTSKFRSVKLNDDGNYKPDDLETYDIERIKAEEMNMKPMDTLTKKKYKSVYRSFKTAMRRNSSASSTSSSSGSSSLNNTQSTLSKHQSKPSFETDYKLPEIKLGLNWDLTPDLITFQNGYSYDDHSNNNILASGNNDNKSKKYSYDQFETFDSSLISLTKPQVNKNNSQNKNSNNINYNRT